MIPALIAVAVVALIPVVYTLVIYNRFVSLKQHLKDSWHGIQVELQRRYDLIPNLVETARGYAAHERETLEKVVELRNKAMSNQGSPASQSGDESALGAALGKLFAIAEGYPDLKADALFLNLQHELANTEDRIAATRRFYNGNCRELNTLAKQFPSKLVAGLVNVEHADYFDVADDAIRTAPKLEL
ncbi:MAG: LemA family protein [Planctomycetota bacterium]